MSTGPLRVICVAGARPNYMKIKPVMDALDERAHSRPGSRRTEAGTDDPDGAESGADALLWSALCLAPDEGSPVADLVTATGMSHRWVNYRLRALAEAGRAVQIRRGVWRATRPESDGT